MRSLRGYMALASLGITAVFIGSALPRPDQAVYSQFASAAQPTASEQIWEIGNQPILYLPESQNQTQGQQEMWGQSSTFQQMQFISGSQVNTSGNIWSETGNVQQLSGGNSQAVGSTFSNSNFLAEYSNQQPEEQSFWGSTFGGATTWVSSQINNFQSYFFGPPDRNACPGGLCETLGIRG